MQQTATQAAAPVEFVPGTTFSEMAAAQIARQQSDRERIAAGESPFLVHAPKVLAYHSTALRLQAVVLNLYNGDDWAKKAPVRLDNLLANGDKDHATALLDMLAGYYQRGENDPHFMALGRRLALERQPKARRS